AKPLQTAVKLDGQTLELTRGESLGEALKRLPGVNSIQTGPAISKPVIHGMHSNRVLIFNSGVRIEGQQWGSEHAPEVDPFLANEISVVKGAASVQYGSDALGGVILVNQGDLNFHRHFSGNINVVGASNNRQGSFSGSIDGATKNETFAWRLQSTVKKGGNSRTPDYFLNNTGLNEINGSFTLGYKKKRTEAELFLSSFNTTIGIFEWAHIGSEADRYRLIANGRPFNDGVFTYDIGVPRQEVSHNLLKLKGKRYFSNNSTLTLAYNLQRNKREEYDLRRAGLSTVPAFDFRLTAQNLDLLYETFGSSVRTTYGVSTAIIVNNHVPGTSATPLIPNYDSFNPAAFLIKKIEKRNYELEAGIRYDYKHLNAAGYDRERNLYGGVHDFHNVSGSVGGLLHLSKTISIQSNLGLAWRPPTVNELYSRGLHHGSATVERGDENLSSEQGLKWINTLNLNTEKFSVQFNAYSNYIQNYIYLVFGGEFEEGWGGAFPVFRYKQTDALFLGADLFTSYQISENFSWNLKGALIRAKNRQDNTYLPMIPADRLDNSLRWGVADRKGKLHHPFLEFQHVFVARQNRFGASNEFAAPPAAYHLFNLSGGISRKVGENN
ncbi:MAG: TonB-dependent receptor, partial [Sphingobacteriales bacterium]